MDENKIRKSVRKRYAGIARQGGSCCDAGASCDSGGLAKTASKRIGYSAEDRELDVPLDAVRNAAGAALSVRVFGRKPA